jgi:hypothetical protein
MSRCRFAVRPDSNAILSMHKLLLAMSIVSFFNFANANNFSEGQVWSYKTRPGEEGSTLLINKGNTDQIDFFIL